ncbi:hypothetical protein LEN26_009141 [Aphanomyces euteiches]|nr:hypothetical protein LEN26_009141 [Aphanomyces euteiches]
MAGSRLGERWAIDIVSHATRPNELIHFDWLSLSTASNGVSKVLVIKDDMSGFIRLHAAANAMSHETADALIEWFSLFGVVKTWVFDCGSPFKNEIIDRIRRVYGSHHHFVTPHCPWANGTVEGVNRLILRVMQSLISELRLRTTDWFMLLPYVQSALNQQPSNRLGGVAPTTAFTRLPAASPLSYLIHPELPIEAQIDWVNDACKHHLSELAASLDQLHKTVSAKSDKKRAQARNRRFAKKNVKMPNFALGDFVLVSKALQLPNKLALRWSGPTIQFAL